MKIAWFFIFDFVFFCGGSSMMGWTQQMKRPFTVADEIGMTLFGNPSGRPSEQRFSPDGRFLAVWSERGRLDLNRVQDSLRFYRSQDIANFLKHSNVSDPPSALWVITRATGRVGPIINDWCWLANSTGIAFLESMADGNKRLVLADLTRRTITPLTSSTETINKFDVHDRHTYIYTAVDLMRKRRSGLPQTPATVGTDRPLEELLFLGSKRGPNWSSVRYELYAVVGGKRFQVRHNGTALVPTPFADLALSPDCRFLVTLLPVSNVPPSWETLYPPPFASSPFRIHAGHQDGQPASAVDQYVQIDIRGASIRPLIDAPFRWAAGWSGAGGRPSWSSDGQAVLLPDTFVSTKTGTPSRPCLAVIDLSFNIPTCVEEFSAPTESGFGEGSSTILGSRFIGGDKHAVQVIHLKHGDRSYGTTQYLYASDRTWQVITMTDGIREVGRDFEVTIKEGLNDPPVLLAVGKRISRVVWDPNPQFKNIDLGEAKVYAWKDKSGRVWKGGLYKPHDYEGGRRYPVVIQTHGFTESEFRPSGFFPTAFAARALAAAGIVVLQVDDLRCISSSSEERTCASSGYESAINQLVSDGVANPEKIGIIGFSRTCFYVMTTLTATSVRLKAASITDGVTYSYLQYLIANKPQAQFAQEANSIIGAAPFGEGLQQWLNRSPGFNLDKVVTPLLVVGEGPISVLSMWESYAGLRYLRKPVDLIMLNTNEHVLTNPDVRMASQGGSVDWFRFWLQTYEDPDPKKTDQYVRWRGLRKMQQQIDQKSAGLKPSESNTNSKSEQ